MKVITAFIVLGGFQLLSAHGNEHHEVTKAIQEPNWFLIHLHPKLVHLPIGMLMAAGIAEAMYLIFKSENMRMASRIVFGIGLLSAFAALGSGFIADNVLGHGYSGHDLAHLHRNFMIAGTGIWTLGWCSIRFSEFFRNRLRIGFIAIIMFVAAAFTYGAHIGGGLVYEYGVGVKPQQGEKHHE